MVERLKALCVLNNTNFKALEGDLGFANGSLKKSSGKIQADRLKALADYFNVSMEYLLTGKDLQLSSDPKIDRLLSNLLQDASLLDHVDTLCSLPPDIQQSIYSFIDFQAEAFKKNNKQVETA